MMRAYQKISSIMFSAMAFTFVVAAGQIANSGSFFLFGEPKCPKSLLK
jgi:cyclic lactone autoinducer peptide